MTTRCRWLILLFTWGLSACVPLRSVYLAAPDRKDIQRLPASTVRASDDCFQFAPSERDWSENLLINDWTNDLPFFMSLREFLGTHAIRSFLIIQHDTLKVEYYGEGTDRNRLHPSYSIAKSVTSALIGIAIAEGHIGSERDRVADYLPEIDWGEYGAQLRIEHLLNHTSGLAYKLSLDAHLYYGNRMDKALRKIEFAHPPGTYQHYLNLNSQLLGLVLEKATGQKPAAYLQAKIWQPLNMCADAIWTKDKQRETEKTFCCLGATALDYAKFGRLFLQRGQWEGESIVSEAWYEKSIRRDTTEGSSYNYNYGWHIGLQAYGDFMANGLWKQHIYIQPEKQIIIVLLANHENRVKSERARWWYIFRQLVDQL
ncbi:MAG: serine hydrolase [Bacteroidota bacterium]